MRKSVRQRRVGLSLIVGALLAASLIVVGVPAAGAVDVTAAWQASVGNVGSVDVTPFPAPTNTSALSIAVTGATNGAGGALSGAVAVTMCGNFLGNGSPITPAMAAADSASGNPTYCDGANQTAFIGFAVAVAGSFSAPYTLRPSGIGDAGVQCLAGGQIPCLVAFGDVAGAGANFAGAVPVFGGPGPSNTTLTPGVQAARPGASIAFSGIDFDPSVTTGTAALCDADGTSGCDALNGVSISTTAAGALSGSGVISATAATGARKLVVSTGTKSASATFVVLGAAAITQSSTSGGAGSSITVSGTNFDPAAAVFVSLLDGANNPLSVGTPTPVTTSATGSFSGVSLLIPAGTPSGVVYTVVATVNPPDGINTAFGSFSVSANSCNATSQPATTGNCAIEQTVQQQVNGGNLSMSQSGGTIPMTLITLTGSNQTSSGLLNQVTVIDARGTLTGWTLTGSMADLTTGANPDANHTIPASSVKWTPACAVAAGNPGELTTGAAGAIPSSAGLCSAASGGGGGTFLADAAITVDVAASKAAGLYSGTLTLTLTGL